MPSTLIITNDFPPRTGGIQSFVHGLAMRRPADSVVVYCSTPGPKWGDATAFDVRQPFPVVRESTSVLLPTPGVLRRAQNIARLEGCDSVLFGAAAPLGLFTPGLRRAGVERVVGLTHGHETGWSALPAARQTLRHIAEQVDVLTYLGDYTRQRLARAIGPAAAARMQRLAPGVDTERFHPDAGGAEIRERHGLGGRPVVVCVSRLVPRKGQDTLVRAWPRVLAEVPGAVLLIVGDGPYRGRLRAMAERQGVADSVVFTGSVPAEELPAHFAAGDVFAMPCRTRNGGLDVEGLGIVYLEASATGLPVVAGASGGAPDAVADGETGLVVGGDWPGPTARALIRLLGDPVAAAEMGERGRAWVRSAWTWEAASQRLEGLLTGS
ncbi:phosphatidylinositol alpha-1,6-mannosyltransferase [Lipingzhangella halophila]|uniref:Phosphatidylinositol alpha-1,6-mannosyltransferase n=1 Tax=Lipingzhangella halophila TaxID=1783352 RepID=A0A7W7RF58_9ACTN|nr:glycosyltransferase family 4 protein [Lipingzhangella halophila]MBB4930831.1 phosphatidylinositol alpha-1,6-mannosyltransferase [Lipingzhangella halophila]